MLFGLFQICKRSDPLQSSTLSGAEPRLERDERQRGACIEGCGERGESWQTRTPFDWLRTGFDTAFTEPFDTPFRQAQDVAQDTVSAYSGCFIAAP
jgi:hypothetical protein